MEGIKHRMVAVNGINMHVAEKGEGPVVLLIHGFPELWYSWRHQILSLAARGYRAVAPDLRGYGDSDSPPDIISYTIFHLVGDLVALIESLGQDQVFVVGHDWGAIVAWWLCMMRPDKVKALVNTSVPFRLWGEGRPVDSMRAIYGDDHYVCCFQEPGKAEAEFAQVGTELTVRMFLSNRKPSALLLPKEKGVEAFPNAPITLPPWLSEEDVNYFATKLEKSGLSGGLNYYRCLNLNWELTSPWTGSQINVPVKFIVGDHDLTYHIPGVQDYIHKGGFKRDVPFLQEVVVMEGVGQLHQPRKTKRDIGSHL